MPENCQIAFQKLDDTARKEVIRLIKTDEELNFLAESCIWPDHPRQRSIEHVINVPRDLDEVTRRDT